MRKIDLTNFRVATSETARQINRRIALNLLRRHQPMSRADLARRSGLQRSTVSAIIEQLIDEGWATEGAIGTARRGRGRRPRYLHLNVARAGILAVDLRPDTTTVGLAGVDARFLMQTTFPTPSAPADFGTRLARTITRIRTAHPQVIYEGLGLSLPGRVDESGRLVFAPNLGWDPVDLHALLESSLGLPVIAENAANACALAELWFGLHPDHVRNLVAVTVAEGIGVGMLLNGQLVRGAHAMAGEFGHVSFDEHGPPCRCGKRGCWERYASNSAAVGRFVGTIPGEGDAQRRAAAPRFGEILRWASEGHTRAGETLDDMARHLGRGIAGLIVGLAPEVLVVVGEVTAAWGRVGPIIEQEVRARTVLPRTTQIVPADPAMQPRLRGAVALVVQQHFGAPQVA
jgi:predicted NBD/HSP70 family sugar kinase